MSSHLRLSTRSLDGSVSGGTYELVPAVGLEGIWVQQLVHAHDNVKLQTYTQPGSG